MDDPNNPNQPLNPPSTPPANTPDQATPQADFSSFTAPAAAPNNPTPTVDPALSFAGTDPATTNPAPATPSWSTPGSPAIPTVNPVVDTPPPAFGNNFPSTPTPLNIGLPADNPPLQPTEIQPAENSSAPAWANPLSQPQSSPAWPPSSTAVAQEIPTQPSSDPGLPATATTPADLAWSADPNIPQPVEATPTPIATPTVTTQTPAIEPIAPEFSNPEPAATTAPQDNIMAPTPIPTFASPDSSTANLGSTPPVTGTEQGAPSISEPAPTDLSQLSETDNQPPPPEVYTPPVSSENLVVPSANQSAIPENANAAPPKKTIMPMLMVVGGVLVLLVLGASAYFILGLGKSTPPQTADLPIQQAPLTNPPKQIVPPNPTASGSGSFGGLNGSTSTSSAKPTSALEALKQRQEASPSSSP